MQRFTVIIVSLKEIVILKKYRINTIFILCGILVFVVGCLYSDFVMAISIGIFLSIITNILVTHFEKKKK